MCGYQVRSCGIVTVRWRSRGRVASPVGQTRRRWGVRVMWNVYRNVHRKVVCDGKQIFTDHIETGFPLLGRPKPRPLHLTRPIKSDFSRSHPPSRETCPASPDRAPRPPRRRPARNPLPTRDFLLDRPLPQPGYRGPLRPLRHHLIPRPRKIHQTPPRALGPAPRWTHHPMHIAPEQPVRECHRRIAQIDDGVTGNGPTSSRWAEGPGGSTCSPPRRSMRMRMMMMMEPKSIWAPREVR